MRIKVGTEKVICGVKCVAVSTDDHEYCRDARCPARGEEECTTTNCTGVFWVPAKEEETPWTPKNGEVIEVKIGRNWFPRTFVGMSHGDYYCNINAPVCNDKRVESFGPTARPYQPEPKDLRRLTEAEVKNAQLQAELDTLKNKLQELLDRIERVS